jgi:hypothetical protein
LTLEDLAPRSSIGVLTLQDLALRSSKGQEPSRYLAGSPQKARKPLEGLRVRPSDRLADLPEGKRWLAKRNRQLQRLNGLSADDADECR